MEIGLIVGYWITLIALFITGIAATLVFIVSLKKMGDSGGLKKSFILMFIISLIVISYQTLIAYFGIIEYNITEKFWAIIPLVWFFVGIVYIISSIKFYDVIKENFTKFS